MRPQTIRRPTGAACDAEFEASRRIGARETRTADRLKGVGVKMLDAMALAARLCAGFSPADLGDELLRLGYDRKTFCSAVNILEQERI